LHWELPVPALQALVPRALTIDTFEGRAYVGVVAFTMRDVSLRPFPRVPGARDFHELNVRTYVHHANRDPGVWFFSLDAASSLAVLAARASFHLPYFRASMRLVENGEQARYSSRRRWPRPIPADFDATYRTGESLGPAPLGTLEHFLIERYRLFTRAPRDLRQALVRHPPYPLARAELSELAENVVSAAGLPAPAGAPHVLYSAGVDVDVFALTPSPENDAG